MATDRDEPDYDAGNQVQARTVSGELRYYDTLRKAMEAADDDAEIWKLSFDRPDGERVRLTRIGLGPVFLLDMMPSADELRAMFEAKGAEKPAGDQANGQSGEKK